MTQRIHKRLNWPALILALVVVCLIGAQTQAVRTMFAQPTAVATLDIVRCFNSLNERDGLEAALNADIQRMIDENAELEQRVKMMEADLQDYERGSDKFKELQGELLELSVNYAAEVRFVQLHEERGRAEIVLGLYNSIRDAARQMAESRGINVVFVDDTKVPIQPGNQQEITRQISARRMVHVDPAIDITDELIEMMNREYQQRSQGPQPRGSN